MKTKSLILFLTLSLCLISCTTKKANIITSSQTLEGITVSIEDIELSEKKTTVYLLVTFDSSWNIDPSPDLVFFPRATLDNILIIDDQNTIYLQSYSFINSQEYLESAGVLNPDTGEITFKHIIEFDPLPPDVKQILLQTSIDLENIPGESPLIIDLENHKAGNEWILDEEITFSGIPLILDKAILNETESYYLVTKEEEVSEITTTYLELEISGKSKPDPLYEITIFSPKLEHSNNDLSKLETIEDEDFYFFPLTTSQSGNNEGEIITTINLYSFLETNSITSIDNPIEIEFMGSISINKLWQLSWSFDN